MIGTRRAAALSLALAVVALAAGVAALMATVRDDGPTQGRIVQTRLLPSAAEPVLFPLDDFYAGTGSDGALHAFYLYPAGYFGHARGCKVVWMADAVGRGFSVGAFVEPCGGASFDRDGAWLSGPAERGLDEFKTEPGIEGVIVDTRKLYCGVALDAGSSEQATARAATTSREECERVSPDTD